MKKKRTRPGRSRTSRRATTGAVPVGPPPEAYARFVDRYPRLGDAWNLAREAGEEGPLDERTRRLVKLAVAVGALREGALHASVRKALAVGLTPGEIEQVVALAAGTLGFPATVAVSCWVGEVLERG